MESQSIVFEGSFVLKGSTETEAPSFFFDLSFDRVVDTFTEGKHRYHPKPLYYRVLHDVDAAKYRRGASRDLVNANLFESIERPVHRSLNAWAPRTGRRSSTTSSKSRRGFLTPKGRERGCGVVPGTIHAGVSTWMRRMDRCRG